MHEKQARSLLFTILSGSCLALALAVIREPIGAVRSESKLRGSRSPVWSITKEFVAGETSLRGGES